VPVVVGGGTGLESLGVGEGADVGDEVDVSEGGDDEGELVGVVDELGGVLTDVVVGGGESDRGVPGGVQPGGAPGGGGGGGGSTVVVGWPSGPTLTTVVGGWLDGSCPGAPEPGMVIGPPGWPLPWTTWMPGVVPCPPFVRLALPAFVDAGPASWAATPKMVATARPLRPSST
jgi:hypothetical protein